jgi:hypothetical protein
MVAVVGVGAEDGHSVALAASIAEGRPTTCVDDVDRQDDLGSVATRVSRTNLWKSV